MAKSHKLKAKRAKPKARAKPREKPTTHHLKAEGIVGGAPEIGTPSLSVSPPPGNRVIDLSFSGIVIPVEKVEEGVIVQANTALLASITAQLKDDWSEALKYTDREWEEIVAAAMHQMKFFDEVTLTPRSGDGGRDVIGVRKGLMSIKVIGSVKRFKPGNVVPYDHIRAMLHLARQDDVSKAFIATTSQFPPKVLDYEDIARAVPTCLELIDGEKLKNWLVANNAPFIARRK